MSTVYPSAIDGYSNIRVVRDNIEEVLARDHNDNRSAIISIEQTLGIQPQGIFGTVAERLDDQADGYSGTVTFGGMTVQILHGLIKDIY